MTSPPAASATDDTTTTTTPAPPIVNVTLDAETISYQTYQLTDGSVWMLPIYNYTGLVQQRRRIVLHRDLVHHRRRPDLHPSIHLVIRRYQSRRTHPLLTTSEKSVGEADAVSTRTDVSTRSRPAPYGAGLGSCGPVARRLPGPGLLRVAAD